MFWKFQEILFIRFFVMLLSSMDPKTEKSNQNQTVIPSILKMFQYVPCPYIRPTLKISWKSVHPFVCFLLLFFRNAADRHWFPQTIETNNSCMQGLNRIFPKCCRVVLLPYSIYPDNLTKPAHPFLRNVANRQTDKQTKKTDKQMDKGENITFAVLRK